MDLSRHLMPIYQKIAAALREELASYQVGDYLPSENQLASRFGVNRHTLRRAVDVLIEEGRVLRHKGRGSCVLSKPIVYPVQSGSAFSKTLQLQGLRGQARLLGRSRRQASDAERGPLDLAAGELVLEIRTLRLVEHEPLSLIVHCFPLRHEALLRDYTGGSLRQHLEGRRIRLRRVSTSIGARSPTPQDAARLMMPRHVPVLSIRTLSSDLDGVPFELSSSISRADRFIYHIHSGGQDDS